MANNLSFTELKEAVNKLNKNRLTQLNELSLVLYDKEYSKLSDDEKEKIRLVSGWHLSKESFSNPSLKEAKFKVNDNIHYKGRQWIIDKIEDGMYKLSQHKGPKKLTVKIFEVDADAKKESLSEDHVEKGIFPMEEFHKGLQVEKAEHSNLNILDIAQLVLDHLKEDEYYYSNDSKSEAYKVFSNEDDAEIYRLDQESKGFKTEIQQIGEDYKVNCWRENEENLSHI